MRETINIVKTLLGLPSSKMGFKKFLIDNRNFPYVPHRDADEMRLDYHFKLFEETGIKPHNFKDSSMNEFYHSINKIVQTYLKAEDDGLIFAPGEKENLSTDHGRIYCVYQLLGGYLESGRIYSRYASEKVFAPVASPAPAQPVEAEATAAPAVDPTPPEDKQSSQGQSGSF